MANEKRLLTSLSQDLGKPNAEAWVSEIAPLLSELRLAQSSLYSWAKPKRVWLRPALLPASGHIHAEPYGQVLIISPWNYPLHLSLLPAVGAMAAGNVICLKPSEEAPHTGQVIKEMIQDNFGSEYFLVVEGGEELGRELLTHPFDYIFFTGSTSVGKKVMRAAAENLTPLTLELGGKNPCIVDATAHLKVAARRIAWGKFFNAGQTCVAPDYLLLHKDIKQDFLHLLADTIEEFYGRHPCRSLDYARIINERHFDRLLTYLKEGEIIFGGSFDRERRIIAPTVMINPLPQSALMRDEIFGPILPCLEFSHPQEAIEVVESYSKPLALYLFSNQRRFQKKLRHQLAFGGACINDCLVHLASPSLPFGGIGPSGMGRYHGRYSFECFSHQKSVVKKSNIFDFKLRYPPYKNKLKWMRFFLK